MLRLISRTGRLTALLASGLLGIAPLVAAPPIASTSNSRAPAQNAASSLELQIELAWMSDPLTFRCPLHALATSSGVVMSGSVHSPDALARARKLAHEVTHGKLIDALRVTAQMGKGHKPAAADETYRGTLHTLTEALDSGRANTIEIGTRGDGQVTLRGKVASLEEKHAVSQRLRQVAGCACVINLLEINAASAKMNWRPAKTATKSQEPVAKSLQPAARQEKKIVAVTPDPSSFPKAVSLTADDRDSSARVQLPVAPAPTPTPIEPKKAPVLPRAAPGCSPYGFQRVGYSDTQEKVIASAELSRADTPPIAATTTQRGFGTAHPQVSTASPYGMTAKPVARTMPAPERSSIVGPAEHIVTSSSPTVLEIPRSTTVPASFAVTPRRMQVEVKSAERVTIQKPQPATPSFPKAEKLLASGEDDPRFRSGQVIATTAAPPQRVVVATEPRESPALSRPEPVESSPPRKSSPSLLSGMFGWGAKKEKTPVQSKVSSRPEVTSGTAIFYDEEPADVTPGAAVTRDESKITLVSGQSSLSSESDEGLRQKVLAACGNSVSDVQVKRKADNSMLVTVVIPDGAMEEAVMSRVVKVPEIQSREVHLSLEVSR